MRRVMLLVVLALLLGGCRDTRELQSLPIVVGMSLDTEPDSPHRTVMTAQIVKPAALAHSSSGAGVASEKPYLNLQSDGETVFDCFRNLTRMQHGRMFFNHSNILLLGEDLARRGVDPSLDFFLRSSNVQPNMQLAVVRGKAAQALNMPASEEKLPAVHISKLIQEQGETSEATEITLLQFANVMISETQSAMMPLVTITENNEAAIHMVEGMAVFKDDRMIGLLSPMESRGVFWVTGAVHAGIIKIPLQGGYVSVEIKTAHGSFKPVMEDGKLRVKVSVDVTGVVVSVTTGVDAMSYEMIPVLEKLEEGVIVSEIQAALDRVREMNTDVYGFGTAVHKGRVMDWSQAIDQWPVIFPQLPVDVSVACHIRAAGVIARAVEPNP